MATTETLQIRVSPALKAALLAYKNRHYLPSLNSAMCKALSHYLLEGEESQGTASQQPAPPPQVKALTEMPSPIKMPTGWG